jgi:AcrR family transcriptional regulator
MTIRNSTVIPYGTVRLMALARRDWTAAALDALATEGLGGVAVEPLARRLNATKGSFYWHFTSRDDLLAAALDHWENDGTTAVIEAVRAIADPTDRFVHLARRAFGGALEQALDAAVLAAALDPRVAPVLDRVTRARIEFLAELHHDLGFTRAAAARQAHLTYAMFLGVSQLQRTTSAIPGDPRERAATIDQAVRMALFGADGRIAAGGGAGHRT